MQFLRRWLHGRPLDQWSDTYVHRPTLLIDGTVASGPLVCRCVDGRWEYRKPSNLTAESRFENESW